MSNVRTIFNAGTDGLVTKFAREHVSFIKECSGQLFYHREFNAGIYNSDFLKEAGVIEDVLVNFPGFIVLSDYKSAERYAVKPEAISFIRPDKTLSADNDNSGKYVSHDTTRIFLRDSKDGRTLEVRLPFDQLFQSLQGELEQHGFVVFNDAFHDDKVIVNPSNIFGFLPRGKFVLLSLLGQGGGHSICAPNDSVLLDMLGMHQSVEKPTLSN